MLQSTRGIVLNVSRYSDSSGIVRIYTEQEGLLTFVIKSLYSRNSRIRPALFGHLALLDLVIDHKPGRSLQYIREANVVKPYHEISDNIVRSTILLFVNEVLYRTIHEQEPNPSLFRFIIHTLDALADSAVPVGNFHLLFMIRLSELLGFGPTFSLAADGEYFDMLTGLAEEDDPRHSYSISGEMLKLLKELSLMDYPGLTAITTTHQVRTGLLGQLIDFYKIHHPGMSNLKSVSVLHEILNP